MEGTRQVGPQMTSAEFGAPVGSSHFIGVRARSGEPVGLSVPLDIMFAFSLHLDMKKSIDSMRSAATEHRH